MSIPYVPYRFDDGEILDVEEVNANLRKLRADITREMDARYTYSTLHFPLDGIVNTDASGVRTFWIRRPAAGRAVEVIGYELSIY